MSAALERRAGPRLVTLAQAVSAATTGQEAAPGFVARVIGPLVGGDVVHEGSYPVTAVLERTAVVEVTPGDRRLVSLDQVLVDPAEVGWQPTVGRWRRFRLDSHRVTKSGAASTESDGPPAGAEVVAQLRAERDDLRRRAVTLEHRLSCHRARELRLAALRDRVATALAEWPVEGER